MCGLGGYIGGPIKNEVLLYKLLNGLGSRGRDGFGYMTYNPRGEPNKKTVVFKDSIPISDEALSSGPGMLGATAVLMHTRAATSGTKKAIDCHPLVHNNVVVVHNGGVFNDDILRREWELDNNKYPQVDSFLIAYTIGESKSILEGIENVFKKMVGNLTFLVFSPRSPLTIWAASNVGSNLFQFRHNENDYLASGHDFFCDALAVPNKWNGYYYPAYSVSGYLEGVWELSPNTMKNIITSEDIAKMRPTFIRSSVAMGKVIVPRQLDGEKNTATSSGTKGAVYMIAGNLDGTDVDTKDTQGTEEVFKLTSRNVKLLREGMVAEGLSIQDMRTIMEVLKSGKGFLINPTDKMCELCSGTSSGVVARAIFDMVGVCFNCLIIQSVVESKIIKVNPMVEIQDEKDMVKACLSKFGPIL